MTRVAGRSATGRGRGVDLGEHPLRDLECLVGDRHPGVDADLQEDLLDLVARVRPLPSAALTCIANSCSWRMTASIASVMQLRVLRSSPGRAQISPHAYRVMKSWKSAVKASVAAWARSTWSSPRTSRRVRAPAAATSASRLVGRSVIAGAPS